ncbi:bifunctional oligoribonuclease/PAP phosphatase NrnA [Candidatus Pacearchaeota archaeon]|nr:bifunctional oligoribonuclease/PAP phosphatase NrnA [Candidatus Pacearchaeota archaeon]
MENNSFQEIYDKLKNSKKVLLVLHGNPDGDSIGSTTAIKYFLERDFNPDEVKIIGYDSLDRNYKKLDFTKEIELGKTLGDIDLSKYDLLFVPDCSNLGMICKKNSTTKEMLENIFVINFDHHEANEFFGNLNYVDPQAVSTCSIILEFFKKMNVEIDKEIADRILLGVLTDSVFFKTHLAKQAMKETIELIDFGADYLGILNTILEKDPDLERYFAYTINNFKTNNKKKFCWLCVSKEVLEKYKITAGEAKLGIYEIMGLNGFDFAFLLVEDEDYIRGSFRSPQGFDVSRFANILGGGGHRSAAGFTLENISLDEAEKKVLDVIDEVLFSSNQNSKK